jgi:uncharacterized protein (UPF0332 family)
LSPRSQEFYDRARERLVGARKNLSQGEYAIAVGAAYYAMLYGARAALSERDLHAKTHRGTWNLLRQTLVVEESFPLELVTEAERLAELREAADYDALAVEESQAKHAVDSAERFLSALDELLT